MWHKFHFHFNSTTLTAFFSITAVGFTTLLFAIWSSSLRSEKIANIHHDEMLILKGITGSILGSAALNSQGLKLQSETLMQDYLNYTFEDNKGKSPGVENIANISVYYLNSSESTPSKQLIGEWSNDLHVDFKCIDRRTEYFQPPLSTNTYLIDLSFNTCTNSSLSLLEYHTLSTPIIVALIILLVWGGCVNAMLRSVSYAGRLLGSSEDTVELIEKTDKIRWTNLGMLSQKALQVRGRNLQYYQTLVLDAQHDVAKVLDIINSKYDDKDITHGVSIIRNIIQRLATEVRSTDTPSHDVTAHREMTASEIIKIIEIYYEGSLIENDLPDSLCLHVLDMSLFERILVNLSSNAVRHGIDTPRVKVFFEKNTLKLRIYTLISDFNSLKLHFAKFTHRIDVKNAENPVYIKFFGRTGRGLSIVKRGMIKLGGTLIFSIQKKTVESGFDLPAHLTPHINQISNLPQAKKRVVLFENEKFKSLALEHGLKEFIMTESEIQKLLAEGVNLEIVSDFEMPIPPTSTLRIIAKKERIEGIALNWLGDHKI